MIVHILVGIAATIYIWKALQQWRVARAERKRIKMVQSMLVPRDGTPASRPSLIGAWIWLVVLSLGAVFAVWAARP